MAVNAIVRVRIDERTKKRAAAAWLRVHATRIAQALDEGVLGFALVSELGRSRKHRLLELCRQKIMLTPSSHQSWLIGNEIFVWRHG
jgi:hypothetical protein